MKYLIVVDMQNDFIDGALGTKEAFSIVPLVRSKIENFDGKVIYTRDTHGKDYMQTREGKNLPIPHCIIDTDGWKIADALSDLKCDGIIDKPTFGSTLLAERIVAENEKEPVESITLVGLCTDICVISNAILLKASLPEVDIIVDAKCCAGVTPDSHKNALAAMKMCQITVEN